MELAKSWYEILEGVTWRHDGNPRRPHPVFTDGLHGDSYTRGKEITVNRRLVQEAARDLSGQLLIATNFNMKIVDRVVCPDENLARAMAEQIAKLRLYRCEWSTPKKEGDGRTKKFFFEDAHMFEGENILLADDTWSTGSTLKRIAWILEPTACFILPLVTVLFNRSHTDYNEGRKILSLANHPENMWTPGECPLCAIRSPIIRPKSEEDWMVLTKKY